MKNRLFIGKKYPWIGVGLLFLLGAGFVLSWAYLYFQYSAPWDDAPVYEYLDNVYRDLARDAMIFFIPLGVWILLTAVQEIVHAFCKNKAVLIPILLAVSLIKALTGLIALAMTMDLWLWWGIWPESLPRLCRLLSLLVYAVLLALDIRTVFHALSADGR